MKKPRYWIIVASRDHVLKGVENGFAQACHGKAGPLKRLSVNDEIIYYSPKLFFNQSQPCQRFTALGSVIGKEVYQVDIGDGFMPYRRDIDFAFCEEISIFPIIAKLSFIKNKMYWGAAFRYGFLEIPQEDYLLISKRMLLLRKRLYCG